MQADTRTINKKFEAKLSWKRKEAVNMKNQIREFIYDNTEFELPEQRKTYYEYLRADERAQEINEEFNPLIRLYYTLSNAGYSLAAYFKQGAEIGTQTLLHFYSRHRLCPVWNWRKSQLIRSRYRQYIIENKLYEQYHPVHVVLTLPHDANGHKGKRFYGSDIINYFNLLRKRNFWKRFVYGGEYGLETKKSPNGNGLHIHIHSLVLLQPGESVNQFREELKQEWQALTDASQVWAETLYFYKRQENGQYETREIETDLETTEAEDGMYETRATSKKVIRKKYYVDREIKRIRKDSTISAEEQEQQITNVFLNGVLECIKYHFKHDALMMENGQYDMFLINDVLMHTQGKRLYSRFGAFYKVQELNFNRLDKEDTEQQPEEITEEEADEEVKLAKANTQNICDPFTGEPVPIEECNLVLFKPERRAYNPRNSIKPYESYPREEIFYHIPNLPIKRIVKYVSAGRLAELVAELAETLPRGSFAPA